MRLLLMVTLMCIVVILTMGILFILFLFDPRMCILTVNIYVLLGSILLFIVGAKKKLMEKLYHEMQKYNKPFDYAISIEYMRMIVFVVAIGGGGIALWKIVTY